MSARHTQEAVAHERAIASLSARTGATPAEVRVLFAQELARLELCASVRSYLPALTASNVRALLRVMSHSRNFVGHEEQPMHHLTPPIVPIAKRLSASLQRLWKRPKADRPTAAAGSDLEPAPLEGWEDEGGTVTGREPEPPR